MQREIVQHLATVFYLEDFEGLLDYGFSVHDGVLVLWDADQDPRVLDALEDIAATSPSLAAIHEHKGGLSLWWKGAVPARFAEQKEVSVDDDTWLIELSCALGAK